MIFHIDANSFYASCERLFRPDLDGKPIVVLSNNDGIIIALSSEAKSAGLKRGDAYFKVAELCSRTGTAVFSSNYTLYADISSRIVNIYNRLCPEVEVYSIDECFLYFPDWKAADLYNTAQTIRETVLYETGMPVSVGIAETKTLAKLCNKLAKKNGGIFSSAGQDMDSILAATAAADVWGIGWSKTATLERHGVRTALDLKRYPLLEARRDLTITGFRTVQELNGIAAIDRQERERCQNICSSKSFAEPVYTLPELEEALTSYTHEAVSRMRSEYSAARYISVYLMTNPWSDSGGQFCDHRSARLSHATSYLPDILATALELLRGMYKSGYRYRKVMVNLLGLDDDTTDQIELFETEDRADSVSQKAIMACLDRVNRRYGRNTLSVGTATLAKRKPARAALTAPATADRRGPGLFSARPASTAAGTISAQALPNQTVRSNALPANPGLAEPSYAARWAMKREFLSPAYTTNMTALPQVR